MLQELKWPLLKKRRQIARLCMIYKATNNYVDMPSHSDRLKPMIRPSLRVNNSKAYIIPDTPTLYSKESFYPKTIREWNILPEEIVTRYLQESPD